MLAELKIENVAVIEKAEVQFTPGLNVLTGETGAGKSIMIDSINAILGNRTSRDLVRSGAPKARIWATFESIPAHVREQVEKCGYGAQDDLLLSRVSFIILGNYSLGLQVFGKLDVMGLYAASGDLYSTITAIIRTLPLAPMVLVLLAAAMIALLRDTSVPSRTPHML